MVQGEENHKNHKFYADCAAYFEHLRKKGRYDYEFEDEYFFTMPAISSH